MPAHPNAVTAFTDALLTARRTGVPLDPAGCTLPTDLATAMAVQAAVTEQLGAPIGGWKIGVSPDGTPIAAPIYRDRIWDNGAKLVMPGIGRLGIEVEVGLRLAADLPPRPSRPYTRDEVLAAIGALFVGVEPVESRYGEPLKGGFVAFLADNMANHGYVTGPPVTSWRDLDLATLRCTLEIDGKRIHDKLGGHAAGDPLIWLVGYAANQTQGLGGLKAGQVITTGSFNGMPWLEHPGHVKAGLGGLGEVAFDVVTG